MSEAFLQMAGVFSQLELSMIRERVQSGMTNAKTKGKQIGRPLTTKDSIPAIFLRHYPVFKNGQLKIAELARVCDLSRTTISAKESQSSDKNGRPQFEACRWLRQHFS